MKTNVKDFEGASSVSTDLLKKLSETFLGSLPKDCGIYVLPLFCQKSVEIKKGAEKVLTPIIYSPFVIVKDSKIVAVELRPSSGLRQSLVIAIKPTTKRVPKYADFDNSQTLISCVNKAFKTPLTSVKEIETFKGTFTDTVTYNESDKVSVMTYNFTNEAKFNLAAEQIAEQYKETLKEWIDSKLCNEEDAKSWFSAE